MGTLLEVGLFRIEDRTATGVRGRRGRLAAADAARVPHWLDIPESGPDPVIDVRLVK